MASSDPFTVCAYSTLDTGVAVSLASEDTTVSLKRKLEQEHAALFPTIGEIAVKAIKLEREGCFYLLSDSVLVSTLLDKPKEYCFLHMEAVPALRHGARRIQEGELRDANATNVQDGDNEEGCEFQTNAPVNGVIEPHNQSGTDQMADQGKTNQGVEQSANTMEGANQRNELNGTGKPVNKKSIKLDAKKRTTSGVEKEKVAAQQRQQCSWRSGSGWCCKEEELLPDKRFCAHHGSRNLLQYLP